MCVWHRNVHSVARRQALNDKKKKTDAHKEKGGFFYSHTKTKQKGRDREKGKDRRKDAKGAGMSLLRNRELPQLLPRAVKVINHQHFLAYYTYKRS